MVIIFYVNDNEKVTFNASQIMHYMLYYSNLMFFKNPKAKL
jgi:hypothetical protein